MISPYPGWEPPSSQSPPPVGQLSIATPELVAIEFPLAGIGSRFVAALLDYLIQGAAMLVLVLVFALIAFAIPGSSSPSKTADAGPGATEKWVIALFVLIPFLLMWGYFTLFEAFWRGQTPGKRVMKIRVIQETGRPVSLFESMARNLLRIIDLLPTFYIVGVITMFITKRQQRVGDLLAGTLVVHEQITEHAFESAPSARTFTAATFQPAVTQAAPRESRLPADAVALLGMPDLHALESYLSRRLDVPLDVRAQLAQKLAANLACKMQIEIPDGMRQETFLEETAFALRGMRR